LVGLSLLGTPFVAFGHNRRVAWGITNAQVSIQDLYVERFNPNNPLQFEDQGGWQDAVRFRETILVRGKKPVVEDVLVTRRGPIISGALPGSQPPISLRWVGFDSEVDSISWAMRLNQCQDWKGFRFAMGSMASPAVTAIYADVDGNIGFRVSGFIPIRKPGAGRLPSQGWDREAEWRGYIPFRRDAREPQPALWHDRRRQQPDRLRHLPTGDRGQHGLPGGADPRPPRRPGGRERWRLHRSAGGYA